MWFMHTPFSASHPCPSSAYFSAAGFLLSFPPSEGRKGGLCVFKLSFWVLLLCRINTNDCLPLLLCSWCASVTLTSTWNRFCLVSLSCLRGGLPKAFCSAPRSCKTVTADVCLFLSHSWWVRKGGDCYGVPRPSFKLTGTSCFYVLRRSEQGL